MTCAPTVNAAPYASAWRRFSQAGRFPLSERDGYRAALPFAPGGICIVSPPVDRERAFSFWDMLRQQGLQDVGKEVS
jgi:hypothetical protein